LRHAAEGEAGIADFTSFGREEGVEGSEQIDPLWEIFRSSLKYFQTDPMDKASLNGDELADRCLGQRGMVAPVCKRPSTARML
jgi:hypothetical protein